MTRDTNNEKRKVSFLGKTRKSWKFIVGVLTGGTASAILALYTFYSGVWSFIEPTATKTDIVEQTTAIVSEYNKTSDDLQSLFREEIRKSYNDNFLAKRANESSAEIEIQLRKVIGSNDIRTSLSLVNAGEVQKGIEHAMEVGANNSKKPSDYSAAKNLVPHARSVSYVLVERLTNWLVQHPNSTIQDICQHSTSLSNLSREDEARVLMINALKDHDGKNHEGGYVCIYSQLASIYYREKNYIESTKYNEKVEEIINSSDRQDFVGYIANYNSHLGLIAHETGDYQSAINYFNLQIEQDITSQNFRNAAIGIMNRARSYKAVGDNAAAVMDHAMSLLISKITNDVSIELDNLTLLDRALENTNFSSIAVESQKVLVESAKAHGDVEAELSGLSSLIYYSDDLSEMKSLINRMIFLVENNPSPRNIRHLQSARYRVFLKDKDYFRARNILNDMASSSESSNYNIAWAKSRIAYIYLLEENYMDACKTISEYKEFLGGVSSERYINHGDTETVEKNEQKYCQDFSGNKIEK